MPGHDALSSHSEHTTPASKIRAARSGDAADGEILAHQAGIVGIGIAARAKSPFTHGSAGQGINRD
jgi:hypothetical protein